MENKYASSDELLKLAYELVNVFSKSDVKNIKDQIFVSKMLLTTLEEIRKNEYDKEAKEKVIRVLSQ